MTATKLVKSVLHVFAYFLVSIVIVVAQAELGRSVTTQSMQFLICDDFARKTNDLLGNARRD